jgi:hypothetical protein
VFREKWTDKEFQEELSMEVDKIYTEIFNSNNIKRITDAEVKSNTVAQTIDRYLGIDTFVTLNSGSKLTFQEKILRHSKKKFQHLTLEYKNDPSKNTDGDFFHCVAQYYMFAYANETEDKIDNYYIVNTANLLLWLNINQHLISEYLRNNSGSNKANFLAIPLTVLFANNLILYSNASQG